MLKYLGFLTAVASSFSSAMAYEEFNNNGVVALTQAGIGEDVVLAKIASLPCAYDVSIDAILKLKGAGVGNSVIAAMVDRCSGAVKAQGSTLSVSDPKSKRPAGIYVDKDLSVSFDLEKLRPINASGGRTTGNGSILFPFRIKLGIPRAAAQTKMPSNRPEFYFYFETDNRDVEEFGTSEAGSAQSPNEFSLVNFKLKDGQREMNVGKQVGFGTRIGVDPKDAISFQIEEITDGVFKVVLDSMLPPGEYGFVLRAGAESFRIYDFSVGG